MDAGSTWTLGIDLSTRERSTAAIRLNWAEGRVSVDGIWPNQAAGKVGHAELNGLITGPKLPAKTGIDAPFGWPQPFVEQVRAWEQGQSWSSVDRTPLIYRATDFQTRGKPKLPLSVSTDHLGATAMACALLLSGLEGVDRTGSTGPVAEVYPAAALYAWQISGDIVRGYKTGGEEGELKRQTILASLRMGLDDRLEISSELELRLVGEHDLLDALVCALIARASLLGMTTCPRTEEQKRLAATEGWIHIPTCSLSKLLS